MLEKAVDWIAKAMGEKWGLNKGMCNFYFLFL